MPETQQKPSCYVCRREFSTHKARAQHMRGTLCGSKSFTHNAIKGMHDGTSFMLLEQVMRPN